VSNVREFTLTSLFKNKINHSRRIVETKFFLAKVPIGGVSMAQRYVFHTVLTASIVAHPDIKTLLSKDECWSKLRRIKHPHHHITVKAML